MRLVFNVFFDIENYEDFFYKILFPVTARSFPIEYYKQEDLPLICEDDDFLKYQSCTYVQKNSLVIFLNNLRDGNFFLVNYIAQTANIRAAHIYIDDEKPYPGYYLAYYENQKERVVYNIKENRWKFYHTGDPAFFEEGDAYEEKRIPDKFNKEKILLFCKRMGINLEDEDFFKPASSVFCIRRMPK